MELQITGDNFKQAISACCKSGALDKASIAKAASKYGFDAKLLEKCSSVFEAEKILKGLIPQK